MSDRQVWQYAYIEWDAGPNSIHLYLRYLSPEEKVNDQHIGPTGFLSKDPDYRGTLQKWITGLGQDGYEMVGLANKSTFIGSSDTEYWFKRLR